MMIGYTAKSEALANCSTGGQSYLVLLVIICGTLTVCATDEHQKWNYLVASFSQNFGEAEGSRVRKEYLQ